MPGSRPARWGIVSIAAPFGGFLCGFLVGSEGGGVIWKGHPMEGIFWGGSVWAAFCILGIAAAGLAWGRAERPRAVAAVGFALNAVLPAALLCSGVSSLIGWLRNG